VHYHAGVRRGEEVTPLEYGKYTKSAAEQRVERLRIFNQELEEGEPVVVKCSKKRCVL
jgi:hypothetical protein